MPSPRPRIPSDGTSPSSLRKPQLRGVVLRKSHDRTNSSSTVAGLSALHQTPPPTAVVGPTGRKYHSESFGCLHIHHLPRRWSIQLVEHPLFDAFIFLTIVCNCFTLAWDSPIDPPGTWKSEFMGWAEWIFLSIFTFEFLVKVTAFGFIGHEHSYLHDRWCQFDFTVLAFAWLPKLDSSLGNYSGIRTLRAMRPLRTLRHVPGMPSMIDCIFSAIPGLGSVASLVGMFFLVLAIVGIQLFKGALHARCSNPDAAVSTSTALLAMDGNYSTLRRSLRGSSLKGNDRFCSPELVGDKTACLHGTYGSCTDLFEADGGTGHLQYSAFDTARAASMTVLMAVTFDTWTDAMYAVMQSVSSLAWTYFLCAAIFGGFFVVNLFLAVLFDEFSRTSSANTTPTKRVRSKAEVGIKLKEEVHEASSCWQSTLRPWVTHPWFETFSLTMIFLNLIVTCMKYEGQPATQAALLDDVSHVFTVYVICEVTAVITGLGWEGFWYGSNKDWAGFDFLVLVISSIDLVITALLPEDSSHNLVAFRVLRAVRALRFLRTAKSWSALRRALDALRIGGQNLLNLFILLLLFIFIFAVAGMQLFAGRCDPKSRFFFDFASISSLSTLSIFVGNWVDVRNACATNADGSMSGAGDLFIVLGLLLGFFTLVNLFIAVLFHAFASASQRMEISEAMDSVRPSGRRVRRKGDDTADDEASGDADPLAEQTSGMRLTTMALVQNPLFEKVVVWLIIVSAICLALDTPRLAPDSYLNRGLVIVNYIMVAAFTAEMLLKIHAYQVCAYFSSGWNCLDSFIVFISIASLLPALPSNLSTLRLLRVLRPLRLLSRIPGMKIIFLFAVTAVGNIMQVVCVVGFVQVVYSVLGMELFSGTFASCTDPKLTTRAECVATGSDALWNNPAFGSFDNVLSANLLLFVASTGDAWEDYMFMSMDAVGNGVAPVRKDASWASLYFVVWYLVGTFGTMNLLVGTVVDSFNRVAGNSEGNGGMTITQRQWRHVQITSYSQVKAVEKPRTPTHPLRRKIHGLVSSVAFDSFISVWVLGNVLLMGFDYAGIEDHSGDKAFLHTGQKIFTYVYYVECILKLVGLGVDSYFASNWCRFDFTLVCLALLEDFAHDLVAILPVPPMMFRILRVLRVLRLLRLFKNSKGLQNLIMTIIISVPALLNVIALLLLVCFIYSVLAVNIFTFVMKPGGQLDDERNFDSVASAALVLFQVLTNDQWSVIMNDLMIGTDQGCHPDANPTDCGSSFSPVLFFFTFKLVCQFVLLNIVVAVVLDNFSELREWNPKLCSEHDIQDYTDQWANFDPTASGVLDVDACAELVLSLNAPLGLMDSVNATGEPYDEEMASDFIRQLDLPWNESKMVGFEDLLNALIVKSFENEVLDAPEELVADLDDKRSASFKRRMQKSAHGKGKSATKGKQSVLSAAGKPVGVGGRSRSVELV